MLETPPRAWGRPFQCGHSRTERGNTPTSVGKTKSAPSISARSWKHPHERGEDEIEADPAAAQAETPPRAWGRLFSVRVWRVLVGNTPTSVGKTDYHSDHRGQQDETPPRAWGRRKYPLISNRIQRNTPTSVGKTLDFTGVDGGLVEIRFVALSVFQSQGACLKFQ